MNAALPGILEDGTSNLSGAVRLLLAQLKLELDQLAIRLEEADALVQKTAQESEVTFTFRLRQGGRPYIPVSRPPGSYQDRKAKQRLRYRTYILSDTGAIRSSAIMQVRNLPRVIYYGITVKGEFANPKQRRIEALLNA